MMNMITALFCVLVKQVISQNQDIFPATILAQQKTIGENSDLYLTCSTFGIKKHSNGFVYLCKNGVGFTKIMQKQDKTDITFQIPRIGLNNSGNYSCVYSPQNYTLSAVTKKGNNIIQILVIANFLPADISVVGQQAVYEGEHVEFKCTLSDALHTLNECQLIQSYLWKNETIIQMQAFNVARMEATFTIKGAVMRDSGHYSCTVLPSMCIQGQEKPLYGKNAVFLEVKVTSAALVIVPFGLVVLLLFLTLFMWWTSYKSGLCIPCTVSQQANADMLEQTVEEDMEAQAEGEESFSMFEDIRNSYYQDADGSTHSNNCDGLYSYINEGDDSYANIEHICQLTRDSPSATPSGGCAVYARSLNMKKTSHAEFQ